MAGERHPEWRDLNATTRYPFADGASLVNASGDFLSEGMFLDASFYMIGGRDRQYLSRVVVNTDTVQLWFGDVVVPQRAYTEFSAATPPEELAVLDIYGRPAGMLLCDPQQVWGLQAWSLGVHDFELTQTELAARVCTPLPELGVRGFLLEDGSVLTGDVWLIGEDGVVLSAEDHELPPNEYGGAPETVRVIRVDIVGDPLFRRRLCGDVFETPRLLKTLTFRHGCNKIVCGPDTLGNIRLSVGSQLAVDTILRIRSTEQGLVFETVGERVDGSHCT